MQNSKLTTQKQFASCC